MNELLEIMADDMMIKKIINESTESFSYRICYSALGLWCLKMAQNVKDGKVGCSKRYQTIVINDLIEQYKKIFPQISDLINFPTSAKQSFSIHVRNLYENTGYLNTDSNGRNKISNFGRSILLGNKCLYFGIPNHKFEMNGLGVFCSPKDKHIVSV